jgi:hypothetical protein
MADLAAEFVQRIVDMANRSDAIMDGTTGLVPKLLAANQIVYGVWQDSAEPYGVGLLIIKGEKPIARDHREPRCPGG